MQPVINYTDKGAGMAQAIRNAGHVIAIIDGVPMCDDAAAVQAIIDGYTLDLAKSAVIKNIIALAKQKFDSVVAVFSAGELAGWPLLHVEALAYAASNDEADCPSIVQEAAIRGITVAALAAKVEANSATFNGVRGAISGVSGKHRDAVSALSTFADVLSYNYMTDWPV